MIAEPPALISSDDALRRIGHTIPYSILHRWTHDGHVTPTQPAQGTGSRIGWSARDVAALEAIGRVRRDFNSSGTPCTPKVIRELWDQLDVADTATIVTDTFTISVRLGLEG